MENNNNKIELPKSDIKKSSKSEFVYKFLLNGIIQGIWSQGDRINDKEISEHLSVNRLAVREALNRFIQNGVIEQIHWKGYYLKSISKDDIESLVQVRLALENLALHLFVSKDKSIQEETFRQMQNTLELSKKYLDLKDRSKYMEIDFHFHELIYEASGNNMIAKIISETRVITSVIRNLAMGKDFEEFKVAAISSIHDHQQICDALKKNDLDEAIKILFEHLGSTFVNNILKNIQ